MPRIRGCGPRPPRLTGLEKPRAIIEEPCPVPLPDIGVIPWMLPQYPDSEGFKIETPFTQQTYRWALIKQQWLW